MSLIEDALDKAEKERTETGRPEAPGLGGLPSAARGDGPKSKLRTIVAVAAIICIILSLTYLGLWWFHRESPGSSRIALSPGIAQQPTAHPTPEAVREKPAHLTSSVASKNVPHSAPTEQKVGEKIPRQASVTQTPAPASQNSLKHPKEAQTAVHASRPGRVVKRTHHLSHAHAHAHIHSAKKRHHTKKRTNRKASHHASSASRKSLPRHVAPSKENAEHLSLSVRIARQYVEKGLSAYKAGELQKAARALETSITYADPTPQTLAFLGSIYLEMGNYDKAYQYTRKALAKAPMDPKIQENMGIILMSKESYDQAIPFFLRVIQARPFWYTPHVNLGIAYWKSGNLAAARDQLLTAIKIEKDRPEAYYNLSGVYEAQGDYSHACATLESFLKHAQSLPSSERRVAALHLKYLRSYLQKKRPDNGR